MTFQRQPLAVGFDLDMTLIDTVPGFAATLRALGAELGVEFPVEEMTAQLGPPLEPAARAPPARRTRSGRPATASARIYPDARDRSRPAAARRARGPRRPYAVTAAGSSWSPASSRPTPTGTSTTSPWRWTVSRAGSGVSARPTCCVARASRVYVGDHVHDVEGALRRGRPERLVLTGAARGRSSRRPAPHVVLDVARWTSRTGSTSTCSPPGSTPWRRTSARGSVLVAYSGGADSAFLLAAAVRALGPEHVVAATGYSHSLPRDRARPGPRLRASPSGVEVLTPGDPRDGAGRLPRQHRRPLLLLQGRADRGAHPARRANAVSAASPPAPTPTTRSPASGPASAPPTSAARWPRSATRG